MPNETYIGDGVYVSLDPAQMIMLRTSRHNWYDYPNEHWIALEPEVFAELLHFAYTIGWGNLVNDAQRRYARVPEDE